MRMSSLLFVLCLVPPVSSAMAAKKGKSALLTEEQMIALRWRPTPTTAQLKKRGPFQGTGTVGLFPRTLSQRK